MAKSRRTRRTQIQIQERRAIEQNELNNLRKEFNKAKNSVRNRFITEQAREEAIGGFSFSGKPSNLFKNVDFDLLLTQGITRKNRKGQTIRIIGKEAVKIQINSLKNRASAKTQKDNFIKNYIVAMEIRGYLPQTQRKAKTLLNSLSETKLAYLLKTSNVIPTVAMTYASIEDDKEFIEKLTLAVNTDIDANFAKNTQSLKKVIKQKFDILGW